jgi:transposase
MDLVREFSMPRLEHIDDPKLLQQVASHLEKTVVRQSKEIAHLRAENARLRGRDVDPQLELELLREQLAALQREAFGPSSEKRPRPKVDGSAQEKAPVRGHGPRPQPDLPLEVVSHTLPEEQRVCDECGTPLDEMRDQAEVSEEITVVGVEYKVLRHERQKYRCGHCYAKVVTAPAPAKLIPGGRYSVDFAIHVAEQKYLDHLPLERQARAMGRNGLEVDSQTLWDQLDALARHLEPTYQALLAKVLEHDTVYADETHWPLLERSGTSRWWTWCLACDDIATYRILPSRSQRSARELLAGFEGRVMCDGYGTYQALDRVSPGIRLAHCWAHVRRKFLEAADAYPELSERAVELIGRLYEVERTVTEAVGEADRAQEQALGMRLDARTKESRRITDELLQLALEHRGRVLPGSKMGNAIKYMVKLWVGLTRFLEDPRVPLDNSHAERALRGVVVGRKNHYGSRSKRGTEVAAIFYTLFETAKLSQVDPRCYVTAAARRAIATPGAVTLPSDI